MSESPNKLIRFWQELKRRKVFGVVTTYAATAYIIIEVTNNLVEPLSLPAWIAKLVILLLGAGLPVIVILSWIFDFTPKGITKTGSAEETENKEAEWKPVKRRLRPSYVLNAILIIAVIVLAYPKIFKSNTLEKLRSSGEKISVAVMPFQNMTNDTLWDVWQDGIKDILITSLSNSEELKVRQTESVNNLIEKSKIVNYASISPAMAGVISKKLEASVYIIGSIKQSGSKIRLNATLTDSKKDNVMKSFQVEGESNEDNVFQFIDSLSLLIKDYLVIAKLGNDVSSEVRHLASTRSPEAYRYFIYANKAFMERDYQTSIKFLDEAVKVDTGFTIAKLHLAVVYGNLGQYEEAKKWSLSAYRDNYQVPMWQSIWINWVHAIFFETPREEIKYLKQLQEIDEQYSSPFSNAGYCYNALGQYNKAIPELERVLEMYKKWDTKPSWVFDYTLLGYAYHKTGQYNKENRLYKKAEYDYPDDPELLSRQAILLLAKGDTSGAENYIERYKSIQLERSTPQVDLANGLGSIYAEAGMLDRAEKYYREALALQPEDPFRLNNLAWFLIDKDRNVNEGIELIEKARSLNLDEYYYTDCKGYGLLKQGQYKEALMLLEKSDSLKPVYNHEAYLHLEAAKKAVASQ
jgi:tetratricopeptide (TPR) repeat protein